MGYQATIQKQKALQGEYLKCPDRFTRGIDPHHYIKDLIERVPAMNNQSIYTSLLPQNWRPLKPIEPNPNGDQSEIENVTMEV